MKKKKYNSKKERSEEFYFDSFFCIESKIKMSDHSESVILGNENGSEEKNENINVQAK